MTRLPAAPAHPRPALPSLEQAEGGRPEGHAAAAREGGKPNSCYCHYYYYLYLSACGYCYSYYFYCCCYCLLLCVRHVLHHLALG